MVFDEAGTYTIEYTATDDCGNTTNAERTVIVEKGIPNVSWADGTDEEIVEMVAAADEGLIDLTDYWNVGDERVVHLSAMQAVGVDESHVEQDVVLVLMNVGGKTLNTPTESGRTECSFIVGQKDCLMTRGRLNSSATNVGGWEADSRHTWCNEVYYNAIPSTLLPIFKQAKNKTANGGSSATASVESIDYFALPAEYEVFGSYTRSSQTYESGLQQFEYYNDASNRIKKRNGTADDWWTRSPYKDDNVNGIRVNATGNGGANSPTSYYGLAPFGCI